MGGNYIGGTQISLVLTVGSGVAWSVNVIGKDLEAAEKLLSDTLKIVDKFQIRQSKGLQLT